MSQHFYTSHYQGRTVTVLMGWDRPLQGYFMVVTFNRDDDPVYSNLDDPDLIPWMGFPPTLEPFVRKVDALGLPRCGLHDIRRGFATEAVRATGPQRRVVSFTVGEPTAYLWGGELVLRDGEPVGQVTSAAFGAAVGAPVGLALIGQRGGGAPTEWVRGGTWEVDLAGTRHPIVVSTRPPFDPEGSRLGRGEG